VPVLTISEARAALPEVINRVVEGEEVTITRHGAPVAIVVRPDIVWSRVGHEVLTDDEHLIAALRERARRNGHTLEEELRMILETAQSQPEPLPPLHLKTVRTSGTSTWTREEIYGDDAR
jgi:plasmid stability protein